MLGFLCSLLAKATLELAAGRCQVGIRTAGWKQRQLGYPMLLTWFNGNFLFYEASWEERGAEVLPVDILTPPFLSVESCFLICISLPGKTRVANQNPFNFATIPEATAQETHGNWELWGFCCDRIWLNLLPVPQNPHNLTGQTWAWEFVSKQVNFARLCFCGEQFSQAHP